MEGRVKSSELVRGMDASLFPYLGNGNVIVSILDGCSMIQSVIQVNPLVQFLEHGKCSVNIGFYSSSQIHVLKVWMRKHIYPWGLRIVLADLRHLVLWFPRGGHFSPFSFF